MWAVESYLLLVFYAPTFGQAPFVSPCRLRVRFLLLPQKGIAIISYVEFWRDFFRFVFMNKIDYLRTVVWLHQLKLVTGCQTIKALAALVDPDSVWIDSDGDEHQSKWYQYAQGTQVPAPALAARVRAKYPKVTFELHHPVWRVLRSPCSARSWTRLRTVMADRWGDLPVQVRTWTLEELRPSQLVGNALALKGLSYLDAVALFASERKLRLVRRDHAREKCLALVLAGLPLLYADDHLWNDMDAATLEVALGTLDEALNIDQGAEGVALSGRRSSEILARRDKLASYVARYPHGLSTEIALRRFLAARWDSKDVTCIRPQRRRRPLLGSHSQ